ncbi:MAG: guanylate kinase [Saprospiraceae bacterium]|nr:guanylate kinase [Saprospiraceae bacterium]MBK7809971.1 guanylate kinase [Saprospiraceae bacterium]MBK9629575.1 guanylate kinase [Saprospiraceae bacterium]
MSLQGKIIILTAPSGSGKTTLANYLLETFGQLSFSVSATTRKPRPVETNGKEYYFVSPEDFRAMIHNDELFEYQEVYENQYYGTLMSEIQRIWKAGKVALFDIDVKGAHFVEQRGYKNVLSIYVKASSLEVLRKRLEGRGTESEEAIVKRLNRAAEELEYSKYFDYVITNDNLSLAKKVVGMIAEEFMKEEI